MSIAEHFANSDILGVLNLSGHTDRIISMTAKYDNSDKTVFLGETDESVFWVAETDKSGELTHTMNYGPDEEEATRDYLERAFGVNT